MVVTHIHEEMQKSLLPTGPCFLTVSLHFVPLFHKAFHYAFQGNSLYPYLITLFIEFAFLYFLILS